MYYCVYVSAELLLLLLLLLVVLLDLVFFIFGLLLLGGFGCVVRLGTFLFQLCTVDLTLVVVDEDLDEAVWFCSYLFIQGFQLIHSSVCCGRLH